MVQLKAILDVFTAWMHVLHCAIASAKTPELIFCTAKPAHLSLGHHGLEKGVKGDDGGVHDVEVRCDAPQLSDVQVAAALVVARHLALRRQACCQQTALAVSCSACRVYDMLCPSSVTYRLPLRSSQCATLLSKGCLALKMSC